jgi:hypothetical protein
MNNSTLKSILIVLGLGLMLPWIAGAASASGSATAPAASIDLTTAEGVAQVQGAWRYADVALAPITHHAPDAPGTSHRMRVAALSMMRRGPWSSPPRSSSGAATAA